jgi:hypothetical protein
MLAPGLRHELTQGLLEHMRRRSAETRRKQRRKWSRSATFSCASSFEGIAESNSICARDQELSVPPS